MIELIPFLSPEEPPEDEDNLTPMGGDIHYLVYQPTEKELKKAKQPELLEI